RVDNRYGARAPGTTFVSRGAGSGATETMVVTGETKTIMGVKTTQVRDREVNKNNELIEDTYDWYAQDKNGDVWYFGEDTTVYKHGKAVSKAGTWEAGKNGALPGIIMKKHPQVDESWRQEYSKGVAEDMAQVLGTTETVTSPAPAIPRTNPSVIASGIVIARPTTTAQAPARSAAAACSGVPIRPSATTGTETRPASSRMSSRSGPGSWRLWGVYPAIVVATRSAPAASAATPSSRVETSAITATRQVSWMRAISWGRGCGVTARSRVAWTATISAP